MKFVKFKNSLIVKTNNSYVFLKVNNTDDGKEVEWITVRGNHIPVKKGQSKADAIRDFIKSRKSGSGTGTQKGQVEKKITPPVQAGSLGFGKEIRKHFDYDKIPKNQKEKASSLYSEYSDKYFSIYEENMDKIQEKLDVLSVEYGNKIAKLVGEDTNKSYKKTNRNGNPPHQLMKHFLIHCLRVGIQEFQKNIWKKQEKFIKILKKSIKMYMKNLCKIQIE